MKGLPTREECDKLIERFRVPKNICDHISTVSKVATFLAARLKEKGVQIDVELVERASLLHDILKIVDIEDFEDEERFIGSDPKTRKRLKELRDRFRGKSHEEAASILFEDKYPQISKIVRKHGFDAILSIETEPWSWEEKVVSYADKRVKHAEIVPLTERFRDGKVRYQKEAKAADQVRLKKAEELFFALEKEIFSCLDITSDQVEELIK